MKDGPKNRLRAQDIHRIVDVFTRQAVERHYSGFVTIDEIAASDYNLNISRYVSTAREEQEIDLAATHGELVRLDNEIRTATAKHNEFLKQLGLPLLP